MTALVTDSGMEFMRGGLAKIAARERVLRAAVTVLHAEVNDLSKTRRDQADEALVQAALALAEAHAPKEPTP